MTVVYTSYTKFYVAQLAPGAKLPQSFNVTTSAAASSGATELAIQASPVFLEAGRELMFGSTKVIVGDTVYVGDTSLIVGNQNGVPAAISSGATAQSYQLFEFIGGDSVDLSSTGDTISIRNFKSGEWTETSRVSVGVSMDVEGQLHMEDRALANVIRPSVFTIGRNSRSSNIYVEFIRPNGDTYKGVFQVGAYSESNPLDNVVRVSFSLASQAAIVLPSTLPLTAL
jgi:predicted secreted protein